MQVQNSTPEDNMDVVFITQSAQLGGTVFTVIAFLTFLTKILKSQEISQTYRDKEAIKASNRRAKSDIVLAGSLQKLTDMVVINTDQSNKNTKTLNKSKISIDKNTDVIDKNTEVIEKTNGK